MGQIVCTDKGILAVEQNKVLIPPAWNKTFAWGYADLSCRLGTYESDKVCIASLLHPSLPSGQPGSTAGEKLEQFRSLKTKCFWETDDLGAADSFSPTPESF